MKQAVQVDLQAVAEGECELDSFKRAHVYAVLARRRPGGPNFSFLASFPGRWPQLALAMRLDALTSPPKTESKMHSRYPSGFFLVLLGKSDTDRPKKDSNFASSVGCTDRTRSDWLCVKGMIGLFLVGRTSTVSLACLVGAA
eukprot:CAMPEP_0196742634 /NCGR_PEP_ID=MMETSP1091-20130531/48086_1 /TAXON_ID=302021 /ORGANISM="Rhodomonas sp., Strain CCMP768" /LENGTH=141 /DNA_ID=CAMNT_0042088749 /DNA_START=22 /DNA_END=444 /DNA_ORIENTATION=+